jgi:hypothetical protein
MQNADDSIIYRLIVERVKRHSMLSIPWEMVYIGLIFVLWISVAIYGRIDPSPFTEPYSSVASDSCLNAKGLSRSYHIRSYPHTVMQVK